MVNYRKITREVFKTICKNEYKFEPMLSVSEIHGKMQRKFKIHDNKISKFLEPYEIEEGGNVYYKNPHVYEIFQTFSSNIENLISNGITPPTSIDCRKDKQRELGKTAAEISERMKRGFRIDVTHETVRSWIKNYCSDKIKEGPDDHFYVSSISI